MPINGMMNARAIRKEKPKPTIKNLEQRILNGGKA